MKLEFSRQIFEKYSNIKFHENPSGGIRAVPCGRTDGQKDRRTDMTKLIVAFRNFAKAPIRSTKHIRASGSLPDRLAPVICIAPPSTQCALDNLLQLHVMPTDIKPKASYL